MRVVLIAVAALLAWAALASAQVAAPFLNPVPTFTATPANPAVLSWDMPSRVGAVYSTVEFTDPAGASFAKGSLQALQAQVVGDRLAFGATGTKLQADIDPAVGGGQLVERFAFVDAALRASDWLSIGIARDVDKRSSVGGDENHRANVGGLTLRLGQTIYIGAAKGTDSVEKGTPPFQEASRDLVRYGAGVRWVGTSGAIHLEAFREYRKAVTTPVNVESSTTKGGTLEFRMASVGVSFTTRDLEQVDASTGLITLQQKLETAQIFFATQRGWAISVGTTRLHGTGGGPPKGTLNNIGAAYLF